MKVIQLIYTLIIGSIFFGTHGAVPETVFKQEGPYWYKKVCQKRISGTENMFEPPLNYEQYTYNFVTSIKDSKQHNPLQIPKGEPVVVCFVQVDPETYTYFKSIITSKNNKDVSISQMLRSISDFVSVPIVRQNAESESLKTEQQNKIILLMLEDFKKFAGESKEQFAQILKFLK